jgi:hypothetical protein
MTTSEETDGLDLPELRVIVDAVRAMPFADRATLMKALIPSITQELQPNEFEAIVCELRLKGERWYEADTPSRAGARDADGSGRAHTRRALTRAF